MIYLNHDFEKNFNAALTSNDNEFLYDLFVNEITDLVVFNTGKLVSLLNKVGIKASLKDTDQALIEKTLKNLGKNKQLNAGLAFLFADTNELINKSGVSKDQAKQIIAQIKDGIDAISDKTKSQPTLIMALSKDMLTQIRVKGAAKGDYSRIEGNGNEKEKQAKRRFWIFALVVLAGVGVYIWLRHRKENAPAPLPLPMPEPVLPPIAVAQPVAAPAPAATPAPATVATPTNTPPSVEPIAQPVATPSPASVNG